MDSIKSGWVYVIWVVNSSFYKIGYTCDSVDSRFKAFQRKCEYESQLILSHEFPCPAYVEKELHLKFMDCYAGRLEWSSSQEIFNIPPLKFIELAHFFENDRASAHSLFISLRKPDGVRRNHCFHHLTAG